MIKICELCSTPHDGKYGSGRFCGNNCSRKFSSRKNRVERNKKISQTLLNRNKPKFSLICYCKSCNSVIHQKNKNKVPKHCNSCRLLNVHTKFYSKLKVLHDDLNLSNQLAVDKIKDLYFEKKWSILMFKEEFNINPNSFHRFAKKNNINTRSVSEGVQCAFKEKRLNPVTHSKYKQGYHITWNNKKVYYRSSYELSYCKYLDTKKIDYDMESVRIPYYDSQRQKERIAIPDFFLIDQNTIVEIKSTFTFNKTRMKDKFKAYRNLGYKVKLILENKEVII